MLERVYELHNAAVDVQESTQMQYNFQDGWKLVRYANQSLLYVAIS